MTAPTRTTAPPLTVTSVPAAVLALAPLTGPDRDVIAASCGVVLGSSVEVDLRLADQLVPGAGAALERYWLRCRDTWDALAAGGQPPCLLARRTLLAVRQVDTKTERKDLADQLDALDGNEQLRAAAALTDSSPDFAALATLGDLVQDGNRATLTVTVRGQNLPDALGGPRSRNEVSRRVTLEVSHAGWRDRRTRRLVAVTVEADEVWPHP